MATEILINRLIQNIYSRWRLVGWYRKRDNLIFTVAELQETKLSVRLINTTNERNVVQGYEIPLRVKGDFEAVSRELDTMGIKGCNAQSWSKSWMKCLES
ncbi:hypothetical protein TNCV_4316111 [Trichonephila clavipes]|nr:hypothetical protein TNCV_4316111 [Trichonephila clavipes]